MEDSKKKFEYEEALSIAKSIYAELYPHCEKITVCGSLRRGEKYVSDIDIVLIPKYKWCEAPGIYKVINQWGFVSGKFPGCKAARRIGPNGIIIDINIADINNYGLKVATRTGNAEYSHKRLACTWKRKGYVSKNGYLTFNGGMIPVKEEIDLFKILGLDFVHPKDRYLMQKKKESQF